MFPLSDGTTWTKWRVPCLRRWRTTTRRDSKERRQNTTWTPTVDSSTPGLMQCRCLMRFRHKSNLTRPSCSQVKAGPECPKTTPVWVHVLLSRRAWKGVNPHLSFFFGTKWLIHVCSNGSSIVCSGAAGKSELCSRADWEGVGEEVGWSRSWG